MSGILGTPEAPQEDPAEKRRREALAKRSEDERIRSIQSQLAGETARDQSSTFGTRSLLGPFGLTKIRSLLGVG
jgi:hypothetical protein